MTIEVMMFILSIIMISFGFGAAAIRWDHQFKLKRERLRAEGGGNSLGTSELKMLIQDAMVDAIAPLDERLERIESHMRLLPEHDSESESAAPHEIGTP